MYRDLSLKKEILLYAGILSVIIAVQAMVFFRGYVSASADEFSRVLLAASWADSPYFIKTYVLDSTNAWQPWHFYMLGIAIKLFPGDLFSISRLVTILISFLSLGMLYLLTRQLFNQWVGLVAILIAGLIPTHIHLSLTPMVDIIFITFITGFLYYFIVWQDNRDDRYLMGSAVFLACASGLRYDGWFAVATFSVVMLIYWLGKIKSDRTIRLTYAVSAGIACIPLLFWLWGNYRYLGDPIYFLSRHHGSGAVINDIGPLTLLSRHFAMVEVLLIHWALIAFLGILGLVMSYRHLGNKLWLYLVLGLLPFAVLIYRGGIGRAYRPHYPFPYLFLLMPFCAFYLWSIISISPRNGVNVPKAIGVKVASLIMVFNLWLVYLKLSQQQGSAVIGILAMISITLSYFVLDRKTWLWTTLGAIALPLFILAPKLGLAANHRLLNIPALFVLMAVYYLPVLWKSRGRMQSVPVSRFKAAGIGMLIFLCVFNIYRALIWIPKGMPSSTIQAGLMVDELFDSGSLSADDMVLVEVVSKNYKGMQVLSNRPGSFVLDRSAYGAADRKSFLLDSHASPHGTGIFYTDYTAMVNPFGQDPKTSLKDYCESKNIKLAILKDPELLDIMIKDTGLVKLRQVGEYSILIAE